MGKSIFHVTVAKYAWIYCEGENPQEAMNVAKKWANSVDDDAFDDSEIEVDSCETYPTDIEDIDKDEVIYTAKAELTPSDYAEKINEPKDWREGIEWTKTEWLFPKEEVLI